jgi:hypothetical protein
MEKSLKIMKASAILIAFIIAGKLDLKGTLFG